jgi:hypothetical protein
MSWIDILWLAVMGIPMLIMTVCMIWLLVIAFKESISCGLLSLFVPFYFVYHAITRWDNSKKPVIGFAIAILLILITFLIPPTYAN